MYVDREALEDRLEVLEELISTHEQRVEEHKALSLLQSLLHANDEGLIVNDDEGGCHKIACPSTISTPH